MALDFRKLRNSNHLKNSRKPLEKTGLMPFETIIKTDIPSFRTPLDSSLKHLLKIPPNVSIVPEKCIYFDTETTGLSGGAGNFIFLAGVGYYKNGTLNIVQYFLNNPGEEAAMLHKIRQLMDPSCTLITYNGKSFDLPLINSRCILNRMEEITPHWHIDLLHPCRHIWKNNWKDTRLGTVEKNFLACHRSDDIPGHLVPEAYRSYILGRDTESVKKIMTHNTQDIASLASLINKLQSACHHSDNAYISFAVAKRYFEEKNYSECLEQLRYTLNSNMNVSVAMKRDIFWMASLCLKKNHDLDKCIEIWKKLKTPGAYIELAKVYEHSLKDIPEALQFTNRALYHNNSTEKIKSDCQYRLNRLSRKLHSEK